MKIDAYRNVRRNTALFVALFATALTMGAALTHLLEMPAKLRMPAEEYLVAQQLYFGWYRLAYLIGVQVVALLASAFFVRREPLALRAVLTALGCVLAAQAVFWTLTYPCNTETANWTLLPDDWEPLRSRWEYSHAAGALFQVAAMASLILAALTRPRHVRRRGDERERVPQEAPAQAR
jgi:hypothetical protein